MSREIGSIGKLLGLRSLICKGALHMKMMFKPAQNFPSPFFTISFSKDNMLDRKLSIYKIKRQLKPLIVNGLNFRRMSKHYPELKKQLKSKHLAVSRNWF